LSFAQWHFAQNAANTATASSKCFGRNWNPALIGVDRSLDGVMGVAIEDLTSGQKFLLRGGRRVPQASSIKIALLAELYHRRKPAS